MNTLPGFRCLEPDGAFYAFPNSPARASASRELADRLLQEAGVACLSGTAFGAQGEGFIRFSYANSLANLQTALQWMSDFLVREGHSVARL